MTREINPRLIFERLFAQELPHEQGASYARRQVFRKSILDFVMEDAKTLSAKVGGSDREKIDQYLTSVRDIEQRVERAEKMVAAHTEVARGYEVPDGIPESYEEHARIMGDMIVLAFQADVTRIATCMLANEGSNRAYRNIGVSDGHHNLSHHQGDHAKQEKIREINRFHITQLAYVLNKLKSHPRGQRHDARQLHDRLRRRARRRQRARSRRPAAAPRGRRRRIARHRAASPLPPGDAALQSSRLDAGARRRARFQLRRQHRSAARIEWLGSIDG